jgi:hypothetical protein
LGQNKVVYRKLAQTSVEVEFGCDNIILLMNKIWTYEIDHAQFDSYFSICYDKHAP